MDIHVLVGQLGDPDGDVRVAARDALVAMGPVPGVVAEIVTELLDEHSPVIPIVAAFVLHSYGDAAVGPVTEALGVAPNRKVRERVDWAYSRLEPSDPVSFVAALRHRSAAVRNSAAQALRELGAAPYIVDLLPLLGDPDPDVQATVRRAIFGAGPDAVPMLQRLRRTPGRHRPFALTALAEVGGWTALDPADQAAVRRLIRIKLPRERAEPMHLCDGWYAFPTTESSERTQAAILDAFGLSDAEPVTMRLGNSAWNNGRSYDADRKHRACTAVYVSPSVNGWTLVFGLHPADAHKAHTPAVVSSRCAALSKQFGTCHWYWRWDGDETAAWCIAEGGAVVRYFNSEDPDALVGPDWEGPGIANARAVAAQLSVNPEAFDAETHIEGHGILALTKCGRRYGLPPGALAI
ncbi:HEAT repeat domain-containing protein [Dactylosporangium matsuzakiense]|uniref:HEAT repeat protein n=1 Tax=Dactylosporangium matsuzakiense TaxID=53360 RepID=A0A9W6KPN3_9ACTN|nr:hypothetical protein [Dactylosporangium matsuzakiense]UWZ43910.1 hypothetical protein Dmats_41915 [Dactylosporangium matsuzakiense]GLL03249.1 hypothetical protein GCM10017581_049930 [Dactylosporangium matsuzakiense]